MKRIIVVLSVLLLLTGCGKLNNTPTQRVEDLLSKYQMLDESVIDQLNVVVNKQDTFNESQKELYKDIMKKQYQNLVYEIKDEVINGDKSIVTVQITVKDYKKVLDEASVYFDEHKEEFIDNNGEYESKYIDYRLEKLKNAKEKVSYTLEINLTKHDKEWKVDGLTSNDIDKISGIYNY